PARPRYVQLTRLRSAPSSRRHRSKLRCLTALYWATPTENRPEALSHLDSLRARNRCHACECSPERTYSPERPSSVRSPRSWASRSLQWHHEPIRRPSASPAPATVRRLGPLDSACRRCELSLALRWWLSGLVRAVLEIVETERKRRKCSALPSKMWIPETYDGSFSLLTAQEVVWTFRR